MKGPIGTWEFNANGWQGTLLIPRIAPDGALDGATVYDQPISVLWDETAGVITFGRMAVPGDITSAQVFTGRVLPNLTGGRFSVVGTFDAYQGTGATAQRGTFGWVAWVRPEGPVIK